MTQPLHPGSLIASYRILTPRKLPYLVLPVGGLALSVGVLTWALFRVYLDYTHHGLTAALSWNWLWIAAGGLGALVCILFTLPPLFWKQPAIYLFQNGLQISPTSRFSGAHNRAEFIPWELVTGIRVDAAQRGVDSGSIHRRAVLTFQTRKPLQLSDHPPGRRVIPALVDMISYVKARLYPRLMPAYCAQISAGKWLVFGPVSIHAQELSLDAGPLGLQRIPWKQVQRVGLQAGDLVVEWSLPSRAIQHKHIPVANIPNLELMLQLIHQYAEG